jgi:hypothetical protein
MWFNFWYSLGLEIILNFIIIEMLFYVWCMMCEDWVLYHELFMYFDMFYIHLAKKDLWNKVYILFYSVLYLKLTHCSSWVEIYWCSPAHRSLNEQFLLCGIHVLFLCVTLCMSVWWYSWCYVPLQLWLSECYSLPKEQLPEDMAGRAETCSKTFNWVLIIKVSINKVLLIN